MALLSSLNSIITKDIEDYCMSLFVDTRLLLPINTQYTNAPLGLNKTIAFISNNKTGIINEIKQDSKGNAISIEMQKDSNVYRFIALYGKYSRGL